MSTTDNEIISSPEMISGIRLQPLMLTSTHIVVAHEVLICLNGQETNEHFFSRLPAKDKLAIFFWQAEMVLQRHGTFFLNLPVSILCDSVAMESLYSFTHENRLVIELQDPEKALLLDKKSQHDLLWNIKQLRKNGWMVWLDDWKVSLHNYFINSGIVFDGVKIDRSVISSRNLGSLVKLARQLAPFILVEGIETAPLLEYATFSGADLGQGYLWPEKRMDVSPVLPLKQYLDKWLEAVKNPQAIVIDVCCNVEDPYFSKGLISLMEQILKKIMHNRRYCIRVTPEAAHADIILYECMPGELPFPYPGTCQNEGIPLIKQSGCQIRIVSDKPVLPWIYCTASAAVLYRYARLEETSEGLERLLSVFLRPWESRKYAVTRKCTYCMNDRLSKRERETLIRIGSGQSVSFMAQEMGCSPKTVSGYKRRIMTKLHLLRHNEFNSYARRLAAKKLNSEKGTSIEKSIK